MDYYSSYSYTTTNLDPGMTAGMILMMVMFSLVFSLGGYVIGAWLLSRIFKKAGQPVWKAWVPVYNSWTMLELGDQPGWMVILGFIPVVNIVALVYVYIAMYKIGLHLGKPGAFVLFAIFLPIVWIIWLAFDKSTWNKTTI